MGQIVLVMCLRCCPLDSRSNNLGVITWGSCNRALESSRKPSLWPHLFQPIRIDFLHRSPLLHDVVMIVRRPLLRRESALLIFIIYGSWDHSSHYHLITSTLPLSFLRELREIPGEGCLATSVPYSENSNSWRCKSSFKPASFQSRVTKIISTRYQDTSCVTHSARSKCDIRRAERSVRERKKKKNRTTEWILRSLCPELLHWMRHKTFTTPCVSLSQIIGHSVSLKTAV